jgi:hypothetical protein
MSEGRPAPQTLTFTVRKLAPRDELVFKSIVRALNSKMNNSWRYTDEMSADLLVLGAEMLRPGAPDYEVVPEDIPGQTIIRIAAMPSVKNLHMTLPLRAGDVMHHLNLAGALIMVNRGDAKPRSITGAPSQPFGRTGNFATLAQSSTPTASSQAAAKLAPFGALYVLKRWPDSTLLKGNLNYLRIATVLSGKPRTMPDLAEKTKLAEPICQEFIDILWRANAVKSIDPDAFITLQPLVKTQSIPIAQFSEPKTGLFARIRSRLGL